MNDVGRCFGSAVGISFDAERGVAALLYRDFDLERGHGSVVAAVLYATALGAYEASVNGAPVASDVFAPGWTDYRERLQYQVYAVGPLRERGNRLEFLLGNGWYRSGLGWKHLDLVYGEDIAVLARLEIRYADGAVQEVATGPAWSARRSGVTRNSLYGGETIDFREPGERLTVTTVDVDRSLLVRQEAPGVVRSATVAAQRVWTSPTGRTLVDFGRNVVGWIRFTVRGSRGTKITLRHAEVLENEELGTRPLRGAAATDEAILSGGWDTFEPTLTYHGFRYAEIEGWPGELAPEQLEAVVVHSRLRRLSRFACSNERVNQLVSNVVHSQEGNFFDVPTDCPQRDERLGWTGDIAVFAPSAALNYDVEAFFDKWLNDVEAEARQRDGAVPCVVPYVLGLKSFPGGTMDRDMTQAGPIAVWSDAAVWVPWAVWEAYGDRAFLERHFELMKLHVDAVARALDSDDLWTTGFQFGDWLDPTAPPDHPERARADTGVVATACAYRSAELTAEAAHILGQSKDEERYRVLAERVRKAFLDHYVDERGYVFSDCPTVYALAIHFGLLEAAGRKAAGRRLAELVEAAGYRIATGFAGTPYVTWALTETGQVDVAFRLLLEQSCPSWLYPVSMGATTVWERWDSMLPDGRINPGEMTSFNHYALGSVEDWIVKTIGGIQPAEPGYARVRVAPKVGGDISWAVEEMLTPAGRVMSDWHVEDGVFHVHVVSDGDQPVDVVLPGGRHEVLAGHEGSYEAHL